MGASWSCPWAKASAVAEVPAFTVMLPALILNAASFFRVTGRGKAEAGITLQPLVRVSMLEKLGGTKPLGSTTGFVVGAAVLAVELLLLADIWLPVLGSAFGSGVAVLLSAAEVWLLAGAVSVSAGLLLPESCVASAA